MSPLHVILAAGGTGGHIEPDEDPVQAVLREVREETGLDVEIVGALPFAYAHPPQLAVPAAMAVYDIQQIILSLRERGIGVLITDHNVRETLSLVERAYVIYEGRVLTQGNPQEIIDNEDCLTTKDFVEMAHRLEYQMYCKEND